MELTNPLAEEYAAKFTSAEDELLKKINTDTYAHHAHAHMLSGHVQGRLLSFVSTIAQPKYILEIGTFTGYSALCLAEGLHEDGELHTIELREEDAATAQSYFDQSVYADKINVYNGNALEIISTLPYSWDIVFIDADKINYIAYFKMVIHRLSDNGFIIADNVLFHGDVLNEEITGKNAKAIDEFNQFVAAHTDCEQVMLTVRDGLLFIKKKKKCN